MIPAAEQHLFDLLQKLTNAVPPSSELGRLARSLAEPGDDQATTDRTIALVHGGLVEEGLKTAIARERGLAADDPIIAKKLRTFDDRIKEAVRLGIVSDKEALELHRIRSIRNAFAHSLVPISFATPEIEQMTRRLFHHPVSSFSGYLAVGFSPRGQFMLVCGEFYQEFVQQWA